MKGFVSVTRMDVGEVLLGVTQIASVQPMKVRGRDTTLIRMGNGETIEAREHYDAVMAALATAVEPPAPAAVRRTKAA